MDVVLGGGVWVGFVVRVGEEGVGRQWSGGGGLGSESSIERCRSMGSHRVIPTCGCGVRWVTMVRRSSCRLRAVFVGFVAGGGGFLCGSSLISALWILCVECVVWRGLVGVAVGRRVRGAVACSCRSSARRASRVGH